VGTQNQGSFGIRKKIAQSPKEQKMTKQLIGILPLLTACTLDMEMSLEVGFNDDVLQLSDDSSEQPQSTDTPDGSEDQPDPDYPDPDYPDPDYGDSDADDQSCEIFLHDVSPDEKGLYLFWELNNGVAEEGTTVIVAYDFNSDGQLDPYDEQLFLNTYDISTDEVYIESLFPVAEVPGFYGVFVFSGVDPYEAGCSTTAGFFIDNPDLDPSDADGDGIPDDSDGDGIPVDEADPDAIASPLNSCHEPVEFEEIYTIMPGEDVSIEWEPQHFLEQDLGGYLYVSGDDSFDFPPFQIENNGSYFLSYQQIISVNSFFPSGEYGFTLASPEGCLHYLINIQHNF